MNIASDDTNLRVFVARDTSGPWGDEVVGQVSAFHIERFTFLHSFSVRFDFGGRRLSVSPVSGVCFVGCYYMYGLAAYTTDGDELWRRRDLKAVQRVKALPFENAVFCGRDSNSHLLSAETGETLDKPRGVKAVYSSSSGANVIMAARQFELHSPYGHSHWKVSRKTFAEMDCAFSSTEVTIAECTGPIRCFDLADGSLLWEHQPAGKAHFLALGFREDTKCFVGLLRRLDVSQPDRLIHFSARSGVVERDVALPDSAINCSFCASSTAVFTQDFALIATDTGKLVHQFEDPGIVALPHETV